MADRAKIPNVRVAGWAVDLAPQPIHATSLRNAFVRMDDGERDEFLDGLAKHLELAEIHGNTESWSALDAFVRSWIVSVMLREEPVWQEQMRGTEDDVLGAGSIVDADGLRELLSRP